MPRAFRLRNAKPKKVKCPDCDQPVLRLAQYNTRDTDRPLVEREWRWIDRGIVAGPQVIKAYTAGGSLVRGEIVPGPKTGYDRVAAFPVHSCGSE